MCIRDSPYNVNLMNNLAADPHYIWFTVIVSLLLISVFYKFTSKLGSAINLGTVIRCREKS